MQAAVCKGLQFPVKIPSRLLLSINDQRLLESKLRIDPSPSLDQANNANDFVGATDRSSSGVSLTRTWVTTQDRRTD